MAYYGRRNTDLKYQLYKELIAKNHPKFAKGSPLREAIIEFPEMFNIEHLVEQALALNSDGQYKFNDGIHEDFDDRSEAKTGTVHANGDSAAIAEITNVRSSKGVLKHGAIRCVILNPRLEKLHFLFIPQTSLQIIMANTKKLAMRIAYNKKEERFTTLEKYGIIEFQTFKELAMEPNR